MTEQGPGYNDDALLWGINRSALERMVWNLIGFIRYADVARPKRCADIGTPNPKMELLKEFMELDVTQVVAPDFNFAVLDEGAQYDAVFCFEVIEHLQNPMWFMREVRELMAPGGVLYLSTPSNPRCLKYDYHFHEMSRSMLETWILRPLGLHIVRHRRFNFVNNWRAALIGVRPLLRALRTWDFRPILWGFIQVNNFYEIRRDAD